jgi:1,6-anhydro-N-acetylmuramate kinase
MNSGIDVAHCKISSIENSSNVKIELLSYTEIPVNPELRSHVLKLCREDASTTLAEVCDLNYKLGKQFADATLDSGVDLNQVDIIASHGQTLWHKPTGGDRSTLQMAEPAVIAHGTKK